MLTILYSCKSCGIKDRAVQVPARETEDVKVWVELVVGFAIWNDHNECSPGCVITKVSEVKIPIPEGTEFVGQQIE